MLKTSLRMQSFEAILSDKYTFDRNLCSPIASN